MKKYPVRIVFTLMLTAMFLTFIGAYEQYSGPVVASAGIAQLNGDSHEYTLGRAIAIGGIRTISWLGFTGILFIMWIIPLVRIINKSSNQTGVGTAYEKQLENPKQ